MSTFPAKFNKVVRAPADIDPPSGNGLACDWGNAEACADDNTERAEMAGVGLKAFAKQVGTLNDDIETSVSDLLGDLMHLCDALGLSYDEMTRRGAYHYKAELKGEF